MTNRIFLSPPHLGDNEQEFVREAFASNYIAPLGPQVNAFEKEFSEYTGIKHCLALSSGTAAMHLALRDLGVGPGDEVIASTLTFIGSVTPVLFEGAKLVFVDCDRTSWNMDPDLLAAELDACKRRGKLPKAVIPTDLYGQCADYERIYSICAEYGVPVVVDAAEAMGAVCKKSEVGGRRSEVGGQKSEARSQISGVRCQRAASSEQLTAIRLQTSGLCFPTSDLCSQTSDLWTHAGVGAKAAVFSFNGNKIITTSGGGMLASDDEELIEHARFLSQQARDPFPHYEHTEIGYNYRMSNIVAAIGRGQLQVLDERVRRKREIFDYYRQALFGVPGIKFMPEAEYGRCNRWLTVVLITPEEFGADREAVRMALEAENIESRPVWKPMHMQPVFDPQISPIDADYDLIIGNRAESSKLKATSRGNGKRRYPVRVVGGSVSEDLFGRGLCLPSGTAMSEGNLDRVVSIILQCRKR